MKLLLYGEIIDSLPVPDFGAEFAAHIEAKKHPRVRAASIAAWSLLAQGLRQLGHTSLPEVQFDASGKPGFAALPLYFSISHSRNMAAALLASSPCAVDIEAVRPQADRRLIHRCLSEEERLSGCDFFEIWTRKECIAKLDGRGMPARPSQINTLNPEYDGCFFTQALEDSEGTRYLLTFLCSDPEAEMRKK